MIVALSRLTVANDMSTEVGGAFRQRPHLVDNASDFLGIEVMSPLDKPAEICLSVSFAQQFPVVKATIAQLDARLGSTRRAVMIGGLAINRVKPLAGIAGADTYSADAQTAVVDANRIVGA